VFFRFPEDARWNSDRQAVEFGIGVGEYEGVVRVPRQVFRRFVDGGITLGSRLNHSHQMTMAARVTAAAKLVASLS
jgi:hypothetical protein